MGTEKVGASGGSRMQHDAPWRSPLSALYCRPGAWWGSAAMLVGALASVAGCGARSSLDLPEAAASGTGGAATSTTTTGTGGAATGGGGAGGMPEPLPRATCTSLALEGEPRRVTLPEQTKVGAFAGNTNDGSVALGTTTLISPANKALASVRFEGWGQWPAEGTSFPATIETGQPITGIAELIPALGADNVVGSAVDYFSSEIGKLGSLDFGTASSTLSGPTVHESARATALLPLGDGYLLAYNTSLQKPDNIHFTVESWLVYLTASAAGAPMRIGCARGFLKARQGGPPLFPARMMPADDGGILVATPTQDGGCLIPGEPTDAPEAVDVLYVAPPSSGVLEAPLLNKRLPLREVSWLLPRQQGAWLLRQEVIVGISFEIVGIDVTRINQTGAVVSTSFIKNEDNAYTRLHATSLGNALVTLWSNNNTLKIQLHDNDDKAGESIPIQLGHPMGTLSTIRSVNDDALLVAWDENDGGLPTSYVARLRCTTD